MMKQVLLFFLSLFVFNFAPPFSAAAMYDLPKEAEIICEPPFTCPSELRKRILFWIDVFAKYGGNQRIFHDSRTIERVYSVIETAEPCGRRHEPKPIAQERRRLRDLLHGISSKIEKGESEWTDEENRIAEQFPAKNPELFREAAETIRCQEGNRDRFKDGLKYYGMYRQMIVDTLVKANLHEDIQYLPFVESAYNPKALSRLNAAGLWQFMPRPARLFGLKVNAQVDERFDPEKSTKAAARYFRLSFDDLGNTAGNLDPKLEDAVKQNPQVLPTLVSPFAITAYNYGLAGMRRAMTQTQTTDFVTVLFNYSGRRFRTAVQNFYTSFLAARHVAKNTTVSSPPAELPSIDQVDVAKPVFSQKITDALSVPLDRLRELNPSLTRAVWRGRLPIPKGFSLKLPKREGGWDTVVASLWKLPSEAPAVAEESYLVRTGDTLGKISQANGLTLQELADANDLGPRGIIRAGQILFLPAPKPAAKPMKVAVAEPQSVKVENVVAAPPTAEEIAKAFGTEQDFSVAGNQIHVETDETIGHYAEWLGLANTQSIRGLNQLKQGESIRLGQLIRLPIQREEDKQSFERRRISYHRTLEDEFNQRYEIVGKEPYTVKPGDNEWTLSSREEIPFWLLKRFNPGLLSRPLKAGDTLTVPTIQERPAISKP